VKNYPTKLEFRFHLGVRQFAKHDVDAAISSFQEAKSDAKHKVQALQHLSEAFFRKQWFDESLDSANEALAAHPTPEDRTGLALKYLKMRALESKARRERSLRLAEEALKVASQVAQTDINFRDVRQHIEVLRKLVDELRPK
jgi:tetratricopeptide (TPR) repeat protein